ncbi:MAG TPA: class I SAM-dependent methyltransferase [Chloroflexota bacterium]|nr:class I SAM-dependent methyltransferase [Chloroflexota bacterium]
MTDLTRAFYDQLASSYDLIYGDWDQAMRRQAETLDRLIQAELGPGPFRLLDCTCGIGTQAIGLAALGHLVHATDLSAAEVERAKQIAAAHTVSLTFGVADVRSLADEVAGSYEVVISVDNALPHLLTDDDLILAMHNVARKLEPGGLFLASIRDYDQILTERPRADQPRVFDGPTGRRIVFQVWDWADDGRTYLVHLFIVQQVDGSWQTSHFATHYRALRRDDLTGFLERAGFGPVRWLSPAESGFYQPIVLGRLAEVPTNRV